MVEIWDSFNSGYDWALDMLKSLEPEVVEEMMAADFAFVNDRQFYHGAEEALKDHRESLA